MKHLEKGTRTISKTLEILHWIGTIISAILLLLVSIKNKGLENWLEKINLSELKIYGFELNIITDGTINTKAIIIFAITAILLFSLMAMVFRNIYLILKTKDGKTPFQNDITRMVKEIGIFYIAIPIIGLTASTIARLVLGVDIVETSVNLSGFITGIVILLLSQIFTYGQTLQKETDGLI